MDGQIYAMQHDTVYLQEFLIQRAVTSFGSIITDTVGSFKHKYSYKDIVGMGNAKKQNFDWRGSGAALLGGGTLLALGSGIVYLADREKFSPGLLGAAVGLGTIGYFLAKGKSSGIMIGKKYQLLYMDMQAK